MRTTSEIIDRTQEIHFPVGNHWNISGKFNCEGRSVSLEGRDYRYIAKYERAYSTIELFGRYILGGLLITVSLSLVWFLFKSVRHLITKTTETRRYIIHNDFYEEFQILQHFKNLSAQTDETFSEEIRIAFLQTADKINRLFDDEAIKKHLTRNAPGGVEYYEHLFTNSVFRLHELTEMLFLKWDYLKDIDEPLEENQFLEAHTKAVQIENLYKISRARDLGMPLTMKALRYIRIVDSSTWIDKIYVSEENSDFAKILSQLTQNEGNIPSITEMEIYVDFMLKSGVMDEEVRGVDGEKTVIRAVWIRYLFTILNREFHFDENHQKIIIRLLASEISFNENLSVNNFRPKKYLEAIRNVISGLNRNNIMVDSPVYFYGDMDSIRRNEKYLYSPFLEKILESFRGCLVD